LNTEDALDFLRNHQPMPDRPDPTLFQRYCSILVHFEKHPDPRCIPLVLNSFGLFDDTYVYATLKRLIRRYRRETVVPHLVRACRSHYPSVRFAAADVAAKVPDPALIEPLGELLDEGAVLIRLATVVALEVIGGPTVRALARERLPREHDGEIIDILETIIARGADD